MKYEKLYRHRSLWMGMAMLWIVFAHMTFPISNAVLAQFRSLGYGGVDIFLFASGLGCYFSYDKNKNPYEFFKKRILRLWPVWWAFMIVWVPYKIYCNMPKKALLGNIFGIQGFTNLGNEFNWYITALFLFYMFTPVFCEIINRIQKRRELIFWILFFMGLTVPFWTSNGLIITVTRIPVYFLGMYFGKLGKEGKELSVKTAVVLGCLSICGAGVLLHFIKHYRAILWSHGLYWYPFILIIPGVCMLLSVVAEFFRDKKLMRMLEKGISVAGKYSFEIYLAHVIIFEIFKRIILPNGIVQNTLLNWCVVLVLVVIGTILLFWMSKLMRLILNAAMKLFQKIMRQETENSGI